MQECPFGDLEGLRIAAEMEKRGGEFYRLAARVSRSQEAKDLLTSLAADEAVHLREFQRLHERAEEENRAPYAPERAAYLSAMAAEIAFPEGVVGLAGKLEKPVQLLGPSMGATVALAVCLLLKDAAAMKRFLLILAMLLAILWLVGSMIRRHLTERK